MAQLAKGIRETGARAAVGDLTMALYDFGENMAQEGGLLSCNSSRATVG